MSDDDDLIGRKDEQAALEQAFAATHHGAGAMLFLAGEAGVGKTRLLEACLADSGLLALKGHTSAIATGVAIIGKMKRPRRKPRIGNLA